MVTPPLGTDLVQPCPVLKDRYCKAYLYCADTLPLVNSLIGLLDLIRANPTIAQEMLLDGGLQLIIRLMKTKQGARSVVLQILAHLAQCSNMEVRFVIWSAKAFLLNLFDQQSTPDLDLINASRILAYLSKYPMIVAEMHADTPNSFKVLQDCMVRGGDLQQWLVKCLRNGLKKHGAFAMRCANLECRAAGSKKFKCIACKRVAFCSIACQSTIGHAKWCH
jgi:hypothetical protein